MRWWYPGVPTYKNKDKFNLQLFFTSKQTGAKVLLQWHGQLYDFPWRNRSMRRRRRGRRRGRSERAVNVAWQLIMLKLHTPSICASICLPRPSLCPSHSSSPPPLSSRLVFHSHPVLSFFLTLCWSHTSNLLYKGVPPEEKKKKQGSKMQRQAYLC